MNYDYKSVIKRLGKPDTTVLIEAEDMLDAGLQLVEHPEVHFNLDDTIFSVLIEKLN